MQQLPLQLVCSSKFGRYPKISCEQVFNMFQADGWMVNYAGYKVFASVLGDTPGEGRGIFYSSRSDNLIFVINERVYFVNGSTFPVITYIASLATPTGNVFIDENLNNQIAICDGKYIYIWDYSTGAFQTLDIDFQAAYVTYQDDRFIAAVKNQPIWRLSDTTILSIDTATKVSGGTGYTLSDILNVNDGNNGTLTVTGVTGGVIDTVSVKTSGSGYTPGVHGVTGGTGTNATFTITVTNGFTNSPGQNGSFESKPDNVKACVRMPGKSGQILIMGETVTEIWSNVGLQLFPYQRNSSYIIDYGCLNPATIVAGDDFIVWLGGNEKSGPVIMQCSGSGINQISTDGINYKLSTLTYPEQSYGFIFKQDGHTFYQLTFPNASDNLTYVYDFTTQKFYTLCDNNQNCHIARKVAYFNNSYFFVSFNNTYLYQLDSNFTTYNGDEIPRIIITPTSALPTRQPFVINNITFPLEQGDNGQNVAGTKLGDIPIVDNNNNYLVDNNNYQLVDVGIVSFYTMSRVDLSVSSDGGVSFGNSKGLWLNQTGNRRNIFKFYNLGRYNEIIFQFRFWGMSRFVLTDGVSNVSVQL